MLHRFPEFICCYCALLVHGASAPHIICSHLLLMVSKLEKHNFSS